MSKCLQRVGPAQQHDPHRDPRRPQTTPRTWGAADLGQRHLCRVAEPGVEAADSVPIARRPSKRKRASPRWRGSGRACEVSPMTMPKAVRSWRKSGAAPSGHPHPPVTGWAPPRSASRGRPGRMRPPGGRRWPRPRPQAEAQSRRLQEGELQRARTSDTSNGPISGSGRQSNPIQSNPMPDKAFRKVSQGMVRFHGSHP